MSEEIIPATVRKATLEEQADLLRKLANRCTLSDGSCSMETLLIVNGEDASVLTFAANTMEAIVPIKEEVRRLVWNEKQRPKGRRR
jgi:hypothetical protein